MKLHTLPVVFRCMHHHRTRRATSLRYRQPIHVEPYRHIGGCIVEEEQNGEHRSGYGERSTETAIINHLQEFPMELGRGFAFMGRQQSVRTDTQGHCIDLVLYNVVLKCYVPIDLKTETITHQDVGETYMYDKSNRTDRRQSDHRHRPLLRNKQRHGPLFHTQRQRTTLCRQIQTLPADRRATTHRNRTTKRIIQTATQRITHRPNRREDNIICKYGYLLSSP